MDTLDELRKAARNILEQAYRTVGHTETGREQSLHNASGQSTSPRRSARAMGKRVG
jgi:hypothetical protein